MKTLAYVYKWTHLPTNKWYIGSRTKQGCFPGDRYICSSPKVKAMVKENRQEWSYEILDVGQPTEMYELETTLLQTLNAKAHPQYSFNKSNNDGDYNQPGRKHSEETKAKMRKKTMSAESRKKIGLALTGTTRNEQQKANISKSLTGRKLSEEHKISIKLAKQGCISHMTGKTHSLETRALMREARLGVKRGPYKPRIKPL